VRRSGTFWHKGEEMSADYSLEQLCALGWTVNLDVGVQRADLYSVALILLQDGVTVAHISGIASTREEAFADAVARANRWLRHPPPAQPGRARKRAWPEHAGNRERTETQVPG